MSIFVSKAEARKALDDAIDSEGKARKALGMTMMMEFPDEHLKADHWAVTEAVLATKAAIDAFAAACEEEARAGIADWIAAAPARMDAQAAAGAQPHHYMHTIGQLAAAASLAEAIKNKVDLEGKGAT